MAVKSFIVQAPGKNRSLVLQHHSHSQILDLRKRVAATNTLAYCAEVPIATTKSFIVQASAVI